MEALNRYIEHTNLKPDATAEDIIKLCEEAVAHQFYGVCVPPYYVQLAKKTLKKSDVKIITVVGFPFGYNTVAAKVEETKKAIMAGADEVDMVMNIAAFKTGDMAVVQNDIQSVVMACHLQNKIAKVIIETALLNEEEIAKACRMCADSEADFVKTSTGFAASGAKIEDVVNMRKNLPAKVKIKAAGGIKTTEQAKQLIEAGASRIGASSSVSIAGIEEHV
ncbi:MAG: deoxyribose-phosphate aldolase [Bacteroidia bacterium]|jgi:deoxyribose-phosphate aldolase|nr:deoxyribose-phosphate aldolase [Bacteroidia bacterium]